MTMLLVYLVLQVPVKAYTRFGPLVAREVGEEQMDFDEVNLPSPPSPPCSAITWLSETTKNSQTGSFIKYLFEMDIAPKKIISKT